MDCVGAAETETYIEVRILVGIGLLVTTGKLQSVVDVTGGKDPGANEDDDDDGGNEPGADDAGGVEVAGGV